MKLSQKEQKLAYTLAAKHMVAVESRGNLKEKGCDSEDFIEVPVWGIEAAIAEAYRMGLEAAKQKG